MLIGLSSMRESAVECAAVEYREARRALDAANGRLSEAGTALRAARAVWGEAEARFLAAESALLVAAAVHGIPVDR